MPGFPSYCTGSLTMSTSPSTSGGCSCIGHHVFLHAHPRRQPNLVRSRYVPSSSYRFLQTPPLASDALASRIQFPMNRAWSVTSTDWVCQLRWANKKRPSHQLAGPFNFDNRSHAPRIHDENQDATDRPASFGKNRSPPRFVLRLIGAANRRKLANHSLETPAIYHDLTTVRPAWTEPPSTSGD